MQRHYCKEERTWLDFEGECSWCGISETDARRVQEVTSDAEFRRMMDNLRSMAKPDITDD